MAKHKKKRTTKVSKGLRPSISPVTVKLVRQSRDHSDVMSNKIKAWMQGKKGFVTVTNPNPEETNRRLIRVPFEKYFGGTYKDIKMRVKRSEDTNRIEISL